MTANTTRRICLYNPERPQQTENNTHDLVIINECNSPNPRTTIIYVYYVLWSAIQSIIILEYVFSQTSNLHIELAFNLALLLNVLLIEFAYNRTAFGNHSLNRSSNLLFSLRKKFTSLVIRRMSGYLWRIPQVPDNIATIEERFFQQIPKTCIEPTFMKKFLSTGLWRASDWNKRKEASQRCALLHTGHLANHFFSLPIKS